MKHRWKVYHWINGAWFYDGNVLAADRKSAIARARKKYGIPAKDRVKVQNKADLLREAMLEDLDTRSTNIPDEDLENREANAAEKS